MLRKLLSENQPSFLGAIPSFVFVFVVVFVQSVFAGCKRSTIETQAKTASSTGSGAPLTPLEPVAETGTTGAPASQANDARAAPLESTKTASLADFVFPLLGGSFGSGWCVCRDIGTSPHIGQDINASSEEISVAVSDGKVISVSFQPACGYAVEFEDALGAIWIYRHLDKPILTEGQSLRAGQKIGVHESYPTSGCGTGPHLHLERRSKGAHEGNGEGQRSERMRACQYGVKSCFFDPTIIRASKILNDPLSSFALIEQDNNGAEAISLSQAAQQSAESILSQASCSSRAEKIPIEEANIGPLADDVLVIVPILESEMEQASKPIGAVEGALSAAKSEVKELQFFLSSDTGRQNVCDRKAPGSDCITQISVFVRDSSNMTFMVAEESGLANKTPSIQFGNHACFFSDSHKTYIVRARTAQGASYSVALPNKRN